MSSSCSLPWHSGRVVNSRRGRPRGDSGARQRILQAASTRFRSHGYASTSVRSIARDADVHHTLVNYHFGSKQRLFAQTLAVSLSPVDVLGRVLEELDSSPTRQAARLVSGVLSIWEAPENQRALSDVLRSVLTQEELRTAVTEYFDREVIGVLIEHLRGQDAESRAAGIQSVVMGVLIARYLVRMEPMASLPRHEVIRVIAPMIALHLTPGRTAPR